MRSRTPRIFPTLILVVAAALVAAPAGAAESDEEVARRLAGPYHGLEYRAVGPAAGGRVSRVAGVPGDPGTVWVASAAGGVWKSTNGGMTFEPVFDDQPVSSIGSIAVSPSDPNVVFVGTGEANIRGNVAEGNGIYRSLDGGETWEHVFDAEGQIGTMVVHASDPDIAYAAVLGSAFGTGEHRGVYRTTDRGATWQQVLYVDDATGASDVCLDPSNPRTLFAGMWPTRRTPWSLVSGGETGGLWVSRDGGNSWSRLGEDEGLPEGVVGKVGCGVAPSAPGRVYALIEAEDGGLFRSDDGGRSFERTNDSWGIRQRAWYYSTLTVDPTDENTVWFPQVGMLRSLDGGKRITRVEAGGWDYHDVWIDPEDTDRLIVGSDAGVSLSRDGGKTWTRPPLAISQFYRISIDTRKPYRVLGSVQDLGTVSGPSRTLHGGKILLSDWHPVGGGEAGHVVADPSNPDVVWAGEYLGYLSRWDGRTRGSSHVGAYPENGSGRGAKELTYRFQWTAPIEISPHDPAVVYHAANVLFRTDDAGQTWTAISPDLTRDDERKQEWSGGPLTGDNTGVEFYNTIFAVTESPVTQGLIWAGTDDGLVHVTRDGGATWTEVTPKDMPEWATVGNVEASRRDAGTAYLVADRHRLNDETPYLWRTRDHGKTWSRIGRELDPEVYLKVVREDATVPGVLYLGTERGVMVSHDDGDTWTSLRLNMPTVAIVDLVATEHDLVVGTLGRSLWILDDLTAVRSGLPGNDVAFHPPPPATAWVEPGSWSGPLGSSDGAGANPPRGALLTYSLPEEVEGEITIEILDGEGSVLRTLSSIVEPRYVPEDHPDSDPEEKHEPDLDSGAGLHRAAWDLEVRKSRWVEGHVSEYSWVEGPRVLPGTYNARLTVGDVVIEHPLTVDPDPRVPFDREAAAEQFSFLLGLRDRADRIVDLVERIDAIREQLVDRHSRLVGVEDAAALVERGCAVLDRLDVIERALHSPDAEVSYDILAGRDGGAKLMSRYQWVASGAQDHPGPPTQGQLEVAATLDAELEAQATALDDVLAEVRALDADAVAAGFGYVLVPGVAAE
jgi:photosystem II stability/assembly factor-like uncharacterized protein